MSQSKQRPAVVLLSGGLDSATTLAIAKHDGFEPYALSFRYGQRHSIELDAAKRVAESIGVARHIILDIDLRPFGGSALTSNIDVPKGRSVQEMSSGIPITYVPARNTIFLSFALAWAETINSTDIFIGVNALDYSGYPDCRPEYIQAYERMANLATRAGVEGTQGLKIHVPLISLTKAQIIARGLERGVDYSRTITCYDPAPDGAGCGQCDACALRLKGFAENGSPTLRPISRMEQEFEQEVREETENSKAFLCFLPCLLFKILHTHPRFQRAAGLTETIIGSAIEVHRDKGPGLIESIYEWCLSKEFELRGLSLVNQRVVLVQYKSFTREETLRCDLLVEDCVLVEVKAVKEVLPIHKAQLLSYMKLLNVPVGLLINFHEIKLIDGVHRMMLPGANQ